MKMSENIDRFLNQIALTAVKYSVLSTTVMLTLPGLSVWKRVENICEEK